MSCYTALPASYECWDGILISDSIILPTEVPKQQVVQCIANHSQLSTRARYRPTSRPINLSLFPFLLISSYKFLDGSSAPILSGILVVRASFFKLWLAKKVKKFFRKEPILSGFSLSTGKNRVKRLAAAGNQTLYFLYFRLITSKFIYFQLEARFSEHLEWENHHHGE